MSYPSPQCPLCGDHTFHEEPDLTYQFSKPPGTTIVACDKCRMVWADSPSAPRGAEYDQAYYAGHEDFRPGTTPHALRRELFLGRCQAVAVARPGGRILDIGCATGHFLDAARDCGLTAYGADVSAYASRKARQRGHHVAAATAEALPFASSSLDCVHMNHVLEHVRKPVAALQEIHRVLRPGGLLVVEVPNEVGVLRFRLKRLLGVTSPGGSALGSSCPYGFAPHMAYFTPRTLARAARAGGFECIRLRTRAYGWERNGSGIRRLSGEVIRAMEQALRSGDLIELRARKPGPEHQGGSA